MGLADTYTRAIHQEFRVVFAAWPPGQPLSVGDVGVLHGGSIFVHQTNLANLGINFRTLTNPDKNDYTYKSTDVSETSVGASTAVGPTGVAANARLEAGWRGAQTKIPA